MSSVRELKDLVSKLERVTGDIASSLASLFTVGKPMPPEKRLEAAEQLLELADILLRLEDHLALLGQVVQRVRKQKETFATFHESRSNSNR